MKSLFSLYTITYTKTYSENSKHKKGQLSLLGWNSNNNNYDNNFFLKKTSFPYLIMISWLLQLILIIIIALINIFHTNWYI